MEASRVPVKRSRVEFEDDEPTDGYNGFDDSEQEEWGSEDESEDESEDDSEDDSENQNVEQNIEEHEYTIPGDTARAVKIRLFLADEGMGEFKWMKNFVAKCTCDGVVVATALSRYIHRKDIRSDFWEKMEEPSEEICQVAFDVFDRYGTVKLKYMEHPVQRGNGVWGTELDDGPLFLIESLHIKALELRRKGLGQKLVSLLLEKARKFCLDGKPDGKHAAIFYGSNEAFERAWTLHAIVSPGFFTADMESRLVGKSAEERLMTRDQIDSSVIGFWRSCGFRRIGASCCFAFSFDLHHQSHALAAGADFDPRRSYAKDLEDEELGIIYEANPHIDVNKLKMGRLRDTLPLHHAALTLTDEELRAFFVTQDGKLDWDRMSSSEATLLHLTACELKPLSTQWLLENVPHADSWKAARDIDGYTPLEALQEKLEKMRTRKKYGLGRILDVSDQFEGNPDTAVSCLTLLLGQDALELNKACLRYGCTCGECVEGFLSARMRHSLICQGEINFDLMQDEIDDGSTWIDFNDWKLENLDTDVRKNLGTNISLRRGFVNMFQIAVECLKLKRAPTAENLEQCCNNQREWPPHTKNYLRRAGTQMGCRAVLRCMFEAAKNEDDKAGDGQCQLSSGKGWSDLPTCRNDHEFGFVARACGYGGDNSIRNRAGW